MSSSVVVLALAVIIGGGAALTARALGLHPVGITSSSMAPTVRNGDWIVARDLDHGDRRTLDRGDVVAFRFPLGTTGRAIKRVVALEGDRVAVSARSVTVNGRMIPIAGAPSEAAARARVETVPPDHVFLLGDNQVKSIDSRSFGPVPQTDRCATAAGDPHAGNDLGDRRHRRDGSCRTAGQRMATPPAHHAVTATSPRTGLRGTGSSRRWAGREHRAQRAFSARLTRSRQVAVTSIHQRA